MGCQVGQPSFTYLGATVGASPKAIKFWDPLIQRIKRKVQSYEAENISLAGRIIQLKSVMDSLPIYWFSLYCIPRTVEDSIEKIRKQFFWGHGEGNKEKLHLIGWENICKKKREGGLGLSTVKNRNLAMLAKWWWRSYKERSSYWNQFLVDRYGPTWRYDLTLIRQKKLLPDR